MKWFFGKFLGFFAAIWVGLEILTGQRKVMTLRREQPPVPLVIFRQSSRFLVLWPVILLTWAMAVFMWMHQGENPPEWLNKPGVAEFLG